MKKLYVHPQIICVNINIEMLKGSVGDKYLRYSDEEYADEEIPIL